MFLSFNLQYLRYERRRVVKFGVFLYLSCITHAQLSKGANRTTSCPGPSPRSKWRSVKPLAKAAEILHESWSILSRDT